MKIFQETEHFLLILRLKKINLLWMKKINLLWKKWAPKTKIDSEDHRFKEKPTKVLLELPHCGAIQSTNGLATAHVDPSRSKRIQTGSQSDKRANSSKGPVSTSISSTSQSLQYNRAHYRMPGLKDFEQCAQQSHRKHICALPTLFNKECKTLKSKNITSFIIFIFL